MRAITRFGDPEVVIGAADGGGGRGRAPVSHKMLLQTLQGFFKCIMINEHMTSQTAPCCHARAHMPRSKGRSRGCNCCNKDEHGKPKYAWWDRDTGAAW